MLDRVAEPVVDVSERVYDLLHFGLIGELDLATQSVRKKVFDHGVSKRFRIGGKEGL